MKAHKQARPNFTDEFPLLPSDKQKAIMEFFLYETSGKIYLDTLQNMSDAEERFFYALMDLVDLIRTKDTGQFFGPHLSAHEPGRLICRRLWPYPAAR